MTEEIEKTAAMPMDDREFNQSVGKNRVAVGFAAEMFVAAHMYELGYSVSRPLDGSTKYDLIVDTGNSLVRVQVKSVGGVYIQAQIGWTVYKENIYDGRGVTSHVVRKYKDSDFDVLAIYHKQTKLVYYVPVGELDLSKDAFQVKQADREKYLRFRY